MKKIVVVEDEYAIRDALSIFLQDEGYACVTASNGREGLEVVVRERPDLVVTDFMMPVMDGREMLCHLRALPDFADVPVLLMSAAAKHVALADDPDPNVAFLRKPFDLDDFLQIVRQLLRENAGSH